ncbi:MAG: hypothetical protein LBK99_26655 [Opitutaceae bacterium]|jgi:hypothetical protein|nr:hypothetical protein [Opitutaceae bacterium]
MTFPSLNIDLADALAELDNPPPNAAKFGLQANMFRTVKRRESIARRGVKKLIRPENAETVIPHLPTGPDERTHAVLRGDFVLCDIIPSIIATHGPLGHVRIATLGMSTANAQSLANLLSTGRIARLTLVVSHYFQQVDKTTTWMDVCRALEPHGVIPVVSRNHAKVILLPTVSGKDNYTIEGSANLRSSDNIEQIVIFNCPETHDFHADWIDRIASTSHPEPVAPASGGMFSDSGSASVVRDTCHV